MGLYLQENDITTLFFGGVNDDQCVVRTLLIKYSMALTNYNYTDSSVL